MTSPPISFATRRLLLVSLLVVTITERLPAEVEAPQLLPASILAYAEITNPAELVKTIEEHQVTEQLLELDQYQDFFQSGPYKTFQLVLGVIEDELGKSWQETLADTTEGGLSFAFDPLTNAGAVLARAKDQESLEKLRDSFLKLASGSGDDTSTIQQGDYRGVMAYSINRQANFAIHDGWLLIVTEPEMGMAIIDRLLDGDKGEHKTLAGTAAFQQAVGTRAEGESAWAYLSLDVLRNQGVLAGLTEASRQNMLVELLIGGLIPALEKAPYLIFSSQLSAERIGMAFSLPADDTSLTEDREFFFGPGGKGVGPEVPAVEGTILTLSTYRDMAQVWLRAPDLFSDQVNEGIAVADSTLSTFFAGRDFGEDILAALEPGLQLLVVQQQFDETKPVPKIKLPSFAIIAQLRDAERMTPELKRIFYSLIGFFNVVGAMEGQPQMDLELDKLAAGDLISASFLPEPNQQPGQVKIQYNFSPTVAFRDEMFVLSSTKDLAQKLLEASGESENPGDAAANMAVRLKLSAVQQALEDNRQQLVVQNMLSDGATREEAEAQIGILLKLIGLADEVKLNLTRDDRQITLDFEISY